MYLCMAFSQALVSSSSLFSPSNVSMNGLFTGTGCLKIFRILFTTKLTVPRPTQHLIWSQFSPLPNSSSSSSIPSWWWWWFTCQAMPLRWFGIPRRTNSFTFETEQFKIFHLWFKVWDRTLDFDSKFEIDFLQSKQLDFLMISTWVWLFSAPPAFHSINTCTRPTQFKMPKQIQCKPIQSRLSHNHHEFRVGHAYAKYAKYADYAHMRNMRKRMRIENLIHIFHIQREKTSLFKRQ